MPPEPRRRAGFTSATCRRPPRFRGEALFEQGETPTDGNERDSHDDVETLRRRAARGDAKAQYEPGRHLFGVDVPEDHAEAVKYFRMEAGQGRADARYRLGMYLRPRSASGQGRGGQAAPSGCGTGHCGSAVLGEHCISGDGVDSDYDKAAKWYRKAAEQGDVREGSGRGRVVSCRTWERLSAHGSVRGADETPVRKLLRNCGKRLSA